MKTLEELRKMDLKKLLAELTKVEKELAQSKFNVETGHSKESHKIANNRKQRARLKTVIREKEVEAVAAALAAETVAEA